jgi:putative Mn2+ efflux pump MntP
MNFFELFLIGLGLSMDCFAVAISLGSCHRPGWKDIIRMSLFFGIFQGLMPVIGWMIGDSFKSLIQSVDHWIAFGILGFIGLHMISQFFTIREKKKPINIRKTSVLISLSLATSIDALVTGITFGFIQVNILKAAVIIPIVTFIVSLTGAKMGEKSTFIPAKWAELFGGIVLICIGTKILFDHLGII